MTPPVERKPFGVGTLAFVAFTLAILLGTAARAGFLGFGGEEVLLGQLLSESVKETAELKDIAGTAASTVQAAEDLLDTYEKVNAGIDELKSYSLGEFLSDFRKDVYHLYPDLGRIEGGSKRLAHWEDTHTSSPFTAYEAISAVAVDLTGTVKKDIKDGRVNIDREILRRTEAAGGFALASASEDASKDYDRAIERLEAAYATRSPGSAAMVTAEANLLLARQNSAIIRLLARSVRLDGVEKALLADEHLGALVGSQRHAEEAGSFAKEAVKPPTMMTFDTSEWE
jgi:hypothetical protein